MIESLYKLVNAGVGSVLLLLLLVLVVWRLSEMVWNWAKTFGPVLVQISDKDYIKVSVHKSIDCIPVVLKICIPSNYSVRILNGSWSFMYNNFKKNESVFYLSGPQHLNAISLLSDLSGDRHRHDPQGVYIDINGDVKSLYGNFLHTERELSNENIYDYIKAVDSDTVMLTIKTNLFNEYKKHHSQKYEAKIFELESKLCEFLGKETESDPINDLSRYQDLTITEMDDTDQGPFMCDECECCAEAGSELEKIAS